MGENRTRRKWTDAEMKMLYAEFPNTRTQDLALKLNRSYSSVSATANLKKIKKSQAFLDSLMAKNIIKLSTGGGTIHRYTKGHVPANKGKKMSEELKAKIGHTLFQKGHKPHNTNYDGHERISKDGYIEYRLSEGKYVAKHRHVWELANGPIPKGMIITFKDRNPLNAAIENLEMITMKQNMLRNTIHRFPEELKSTIRLVKKLKKTINEKQD